MATHVDSRTDGHFALFVDGDLQFDTADEALYHESLALPALTLSQPADPDGLRVLICGGGDGLALRECLRFPGVRSVDLVDSSPEIVELGRTRFADINCGSFDDPRVAVHLADAWEFLPGAGTYDVILCDFTVPRRLEDTRVFSVEWYRRLQDALAPDGMIALNAVSPQVTPEAFWCLRRTVRAAGLNALPYRVCIPSFRAQGYGAWAFLLAGHRPLQSAQFRSLVCPVATRQADLTRLRRGMRFTRGQRGLETSVPINTLTDPCLLRLLLNPGRSSESVAAPGERTESVPYDLDPLLRAIPISHPYHTRAMIETLAAQVVGTVRALDIQRLIKAVLRRAIDLPYGIRRELLRLRDYLRHRVAGLEQFGAWGVRLFATLVLLMTIANAIAPDNAFAKGSFGLGHVSMSRGFSGSFSGGRGFGSTSHGSTSFGGEAAAGGGSRGAGSFGSIGTDGSGGFGGGRFARPGLFEAPRSITYSGFRSGYSSGEATDIYGYAYRPRVFRFYNEPGTHYYGGGSGAYSGTGASPNHGAEPQEHKARFVADDDMLVLDNGDVVVTLSDTVFLRIRKGEVALMSDKSASPLFMLYPAPELFEAIRRQIGEQQVIARREVEVRRDWLSWTGWTGALIPTVAEDRAEMQQIQDLAKRLDTAMAELGAPTPAHTPTPVPPDAVEILTGGFLLPDDTVALCDPNGRWWYADGEQLRPEQTDAKAVACPAELMVALKSVWRKLDREIRADIESDNNDLSQLALERTSLEKDMAEYQSIFQSNGFQGDFEVDYGTDTIPVSEAINRTQQDLDRNNRDKDASLQERARPWSEVQRIDSAIRRYGP